MEKEKEKRPSVDEQPLKAREPLPDTPVGNAQYDAELGDDATEKRPPIAGGLLERFGVKEITVDPDDAE